MRTSYLSVALLPNPDETACKVYTSGATTFDIGQARIQFASALDARLWLDECRQLLADADQRHPDYGLCLAQTWGGFTCNEPADHEGDHFAWATGPRTPGSECVRWPQ